MDVCTWAFYLNLQTIFQDQFQTTSLLGRELIFFLPLTRSLTLKQTHTEGSGM